MEQFVRDRITALRMKKGVSEYQMSYALGHSRGYINNITSGKSLPSLSEFFSICDYFEIRPVDFFETEVQDPNTYHDLIELTKKMNSNDLLLIYELALRLTNSNISN